MRKLIVFTMLTLDGVMQAPGGPDEDTSSSFKYGGWIVPYADDAFDQVLKQELSKPFDLLLGRTTYDVFADYWPEKTSFVGTAFNKAHKYVVSGNGSIVLTWDDSSLITGDVVAGIKALKQGNGPDLQVHGSSVLAQTLLANDLVDELRLRIFPITLGTGKRLFESGTMPAAFEVIDTKALSSGVILANYRRAGDVKTGSLN